MKLLNPIFFVALLAACAEGSRDSPQAPPPTTSAPAQIRKVAPELPAEAPTPPAPDPRRDALDAIVAREFDAVCLYLEFELLDPEICEYFATRASAGSARLSSRTLERFLRSQDVARRHGSIRGWYDEPRSYEARVNGRTSILEVTDTQFQTTGRFTMWAQRLPDEEVEMVSGRIMDVPYYVEWTLADDMLDAMRARGERAQERALAILMRLVLYWVDDRKNLEDEPLPEDWPAFVAAHESEAAAEAETDEANR